MKRDESSGTAAAAAAVRACHFLYDHPRVFADPYAIALTSPGWRMVAKSRLLHWLIVRKCLGGLRPVHGLILGRARFTEDKLEVALAHDIRQYAIVGAGFDTFVLRRGDLASSLRVFELDHPASQALKRRRMLELNARLPGNLELIPVDFEKQTVGEALAGSGFDRQRPAFFSWLGTTFYLTRETVFATLGSIARCAAPGSEIVFDYLIRDELVSAGEQRVLDRTRRFAARRGEPIITAFDPRELAALVCALGYELVEQQSADGMRERYFANRADGLYPMLGAGIAHFRVC